MKESMARALIDDFRLRSASEQVAKGINEFKSLGIERHLVEEALKLELSAVYVCEDGTEKALETS